MDYVKKEVFTDERKLEQRKKGFERAKFNVKATVLSEFMWDNMETKVGIIQKLEYFFTFN